MSDNIAGLPSGNYASENVYRVKHIDRDTGGRSGEGFERHTKEEEQEESEEATSQPLIVHDLEPVIVRDDMILSDSARQILESSDDTTPVTESQKQSAPEQLQNVPLLGEGPVGSHIDITA